VGAGRAQRLIDKKTVFVLGAGASCPYGYPSGTRLRERICLHKGFMQDFNSYRLAEKLTPEKDTIRLQGTRKFKDAFNKSKIKSIDMFMANNPSLASIGKYIVAFEIFRAEQQSLFGEEAKLSKESLVFAQKGPLALLAQPLFLGDDWYFYLYNRLVEGLVGKDALPDFSDDKLAFITFNYDRSLEQFLYESLSNSFTEVPEAEIIKCLKKLKILHVYGQIMSLKWQDSEQGVDYHPQINEPLLEKAAANIKTIYEQKESLELNDARRLLTQAEQIFFLGFGYALENLEILKLPDRTKRTTSIYGTTFGLEIREKFDIRSRIREWLPVEAIDYVTIGHVNSTENMDCLKLLRNYF
jgi:hypothetical protein